MPEITEEVFDPPAFVREHGLDPAEWALVRIDKKRWTQATKNGPVPCEHVSARFVRVFGPKLAVTVEKRLEALGRKRHQPVKAHRGTRGDLLLELVLTDMHLGAWANGDPKKHAERIVRVASALADRAHAAHGEKIERCLLVLPGDVLHADSIRGETTKGTRLEDVSISYADMFREAFSCLVEVVDRLRNRWPCTVLVVPGNHDFHALFAVGEALHAYYRQDSRVLIDCKTAKYRYVRWGTVLLGVTHGDTGKIVDYPSLMAAERPEDWGETTHREWHCGHKHAQMQFEKNGVRVRFLPALCRRSAWAENQGFGPSREGAEAYLWSRSRGYRGHLYEEP